MSFVPYVIFACGVTVGYANGIANDEQLTPLHKYSGAYHLTNAICAFIGASFLSYINHITAVNGIWVALTIASTVGCFITSSVLVLGEAHEAEQEMWHSIRGLKSLNINMISYIFIHLPLYTRYKVRWGWPGLGIVLGLSVLWGVSAWGDFRELRYKNVEASHGDNVSRAAVAPLYFEVQRHYILLLSMEGIYHMHSFPCTAGVRVRQGFTFRSCIIG